MKLFISWHLRLWGESPRFTDEAVIDVEGSAYAYHSPSFCPTPSVFLHEEEICVEFTRQGKPICRGELAQAIRRVEVSPNYHGYSYELKWLMNQKSEACAKQLRSSHQGTVSGGAVVVAWVDGSRGLVPGLVANTTFQVEQVVTTYGGYASRDRQADGVEVRDGRFIGRGPLDWFKPVGVPQAGARLPVVLPEYPEAPIHQVRLTCVGSHPLRISPLS